MSKTNPLPDIFRVALDTEDDALATILYNAFLPLWNHNWFQGLSAPLSSISASQPISSLSNLQKARRGFYLSLIKSTRLLQGSILVLCDADHNIHAILLWLPPHQRLSITKLATLYQSGFLGSILAYGVSCVYRVNFVFEANVDNMFTKAGVDAENCGFVQMLAANPVFKGNGSASRLLAWQLERHAVEYPGVDVVLDTTTESGLRAYTRLSFVQIASTSVNTGTDALGVLLAKDASEETRAAGRRTCRQWVMIRRSQSPAV